MRASAPVRVRAWVLRGISLTFVMLAPSRPLYAQQTDPDTLAISLSEAVRIATEHHPSVEAADFRVLEQESRVRQARSQFLPNLTGSVTEAQRTFNTATFGFELPTPPGEVPLFDPNGEVLGPVRTTDVRSQLSQRLFDWGAIKRYQAAGATVELARASEESVVETVAGAAARGYVAVLRAAGRLGALEEDLDQAQDLLDMSQALLDAGTGVAVDVTRGRARVASVEAEIIAARNAYQRTELELARSLGVPMTTSFALTDTLSAPNGEPTPTPDSSVATALGERAELSALDRRTEAARLEVGAAHADRYPTVSVFADGGWIGTDLGHLLRTYSWGLQVSIPMFDGGLRSGRRDEAHAVLNETRAMRDDLEARVELEVRSALIDLETARLQVAAAAASVDLASLEFDQTQSSFEAGVVGNGDVVDAGLRLSQSRALEVDALASYLLADVELRRAMGSLP